jgi:hypothetical protein
MAVLQHVVITTIGSYLMLLDSMQVVHASRNDEEYAALRREMAELSGNTVRLITQAEELVEESKRLFEGIKAFESRSAKPKRSAPTP